MTMESSSFERRVDAQPIPVYITPAVDASDEISLVDLWRVLARRKGIVLLSLLVAIALAAIYIMLVQPVYMAEAHLLPPQQRDIQGLMIDYRGEKEAKQRYAPGIVYQELLENLKSRGLRREFFDNHKLLEHYAHGQKDINTGQIFDTQFDKSIQVQIDNKDAAFVTVTLRDSDPQQAALWLNQFITLVNERTVQQLSDNVIVAIQAEIERVRYQITSKLKLAGQRRSDTIINLKEALQVAKALGIEQPVALRVRSEKSLAEVAVNTADVPLYTRGSRALEAEIAMLKSRKSDESFIPGLRDLQEKRAYLEGLSIDRARLAAVTIDLKATVPYRAEKPRKALIVLLASILGIMTGFFLVFVAEIVVKVRRVNSKASC